MAYRFLEDEPQEPNFDINSLHRLPAQAISGAAAAIPGFVGNVLKPVNDYAVGPLTSAITGNESVPYEETLLGKAIPTTATHKKNLQEGIPYLRPKNKIEKFANELGTDAAELYLPGKAFKGGQYALSPLKSIGISVAGNGLGEATTQYTGDESKGNLVKHATMLALSLFNKPKAEAIVGQEYGKAQKLLPANATENATKLERNLNGLKNQVLNKRQYADLSDKEKFVIDEADKVLRQIVNGEVNIDTLVSVKRTLNDNLNKFIFSSPDKSKNSGARQLTKNIVGYIKDTFEDYGKKNPEWWKVQKGADDAFGAVQQSNKISRILEPYLKGRPEGLAHLLGGAYTLGSSLVSGPLAATSFAGYQAYKLLHRISASPVLRNHYGKVISAAAKENPKLLKDALDVLQGDIQKSESKEKNKYKILD